MRLGLLLAYWPWLSLEEQIALTDIAENSSLDSVWLAEVWGQDAVSITGFLAARTERLSFGTALMQIPARQPTATAMATATLDVITRGRFRLGLGVSGPQVSEGWYGVPFRRPLARTREYVEVVRKTLARDGALTNDGPEYPLPLTEELGGCGLGKPIKLLVKPHSDRIPIYLGSVGPKAIEMCGEIADGWLPSMFNPDDAHDNMASLRAGVEKAGPSMSDIDVAPCVPTAIHEDIDTARDQVRPLMAWYLGSMGHTSKNFYVETVERAGHGESARRVQELAAAGDRRGAAAAVSDDLIDATCIACTPHHLDKQLSRYEAAGVNTLICFPFGDREATTRHLAAACTAT